MEYISTALLFHEEYRSNFWKSAPLFYKISGSISDLDDIMYLLHHIFYVNHKHVRNNNNIVL